MFERYDLNDPTVTATARIHEMTRITADGVKVNVHVIPAVSEPKPDFEAMRRLVAEPEIEGKATQENGQEKEG